MSKSGAIGVLSFYITVLLCNNNPSLFHITVLLRTRSLFAFCLSLYRHRMDSYEKSAISYLLIMPTNIHLSILDYSILVLYCLFIVGIGFALKRYMKISADFFMSGRSIPAWVTGLAFLSANLGALELVGMAASGAKYGIATAHFYCLGAIPAMVFWPSL